MKFTPPEELPPAILPEVTPPILPPTEEETFHELQEKEFFSEETPPDFEEIPPEETPAVVVTPLRDKVPSNWVLKMEGDVLVGYSNMTEETFKGTHLSFNEALRG